MFLSKFSRNSDLPCAERTRFREFLFFLLDIFIIHTLTQCFARKNMDRVYSNDFGNTLTKNVYFAY